MKSVSSSQNLPVYDGCQAKTHIQSTPVVKQSGKMGGDPGWGGVDWGADLRAQRFIKFTSFPSPPAFCLWALILALPTSLFNSKFLLLESLQQQWNLHILCTPRPPVAGLPWFLCHALLQGLSTGQRLSTVGLQVGAESVSPPLPPPFAMGWGSAREWSLELGVSLATSRWAATMPTSWATRSLPCRTWMTVWPVT